MIPFKHEPPKNGNAIEDGVDMSDICEQKELGSEPDDFQWMSCKRANRMANTVIRSLYAPNLTPGPKENVMIMDSAADWPECI